MIFGARPPALDARLVRWRLRVLVLLLVALAVGGLQWAWPAFNSSIDDRTAGFWWRSSPLPQAERRVVIVDIDEKSLTEIGPWPWPRERLAQLAERLQALETGLVAFDIVLPDAREGDAQLSLAARSLPLVLGQVLVSDEDVHFPPRVGRLAAPLDSPACGPYTVAARGYLGVSESISGAAAGHITPTVSPDGTVRGVPALMCFEGKVYPSLTLAALLRASDLPPTLTVTPGAGLLEPAWRIAHPQLPGISVPIGANGEWLASYAKSRSAFVSISAADVLQGKAPADLLRGSWALVGATALGIADAVPTPLGGTVSGVEVHTQLISALLDDRTPFVPRGERAGQVLAAALAALALLALSLRRGRAIVVILPLAGLLIALALYGLQGWLLIDQQLWVGATLPATFATLTGMGLGAAELAITRHERELVYNNLASYLPRSTAQAIAFRVPANELDAQHAELVLLHADIRNFSAWCEQRPAEESAHVLHLFFSLCAQAVEEHGGTIEEYVGDAVLASWPRTADPQYILRAAHQIVQFAADLLPQPAADLEPLAVGVGIEQGRVLIGSFGPASRRNHTALGQAVTVAIRLQQLTAELAQGVLIGPIIAARLPRHTHRSQGVFLLEGLSEPREVFAAIDEKSTISDHRMTP